MKTKLLQRKRVLCAVLFVLLFGVGKVYAQTIFIVDNIYYSVNDDGASVTVESPANENGATGALNIPASVSYEGQSYTVTVIGYGAFDNCDRLTSVSLPETVMIVEGLAFFKCGGLTSVSLPNTLTTIGTRAFASCHGLTSITIPSSVEYIGYSAFGGDVFTHTNYTGSLEGWCNITFMNPNSNPVYISHNLFINGIELTDAVIPETVTHIGDYAFCGCSSLVSLSFPETVTQIGLWSFMYCSGLNSLYIPNTVTSIGSHAFTNCSLEQITVMEGNPNYDSRNDCNALIDSHTNTLLFGSDNTIIPSNVTAIDTLAFSFCEGLEYVNIPACLTSIYDRAFVGCSGLTQINVDSENPIYNSQNNCNAIIETATNTLIAGCKSTIIPESVTVIRKYAFSGCSDLLSIGIPQNITSIEDHAFNGCNNLYSVISYATTPPTLGNYVFYNVPCTTLIVPCGCVPAYESSDWANYFTTIIEDCTGLSEDGEDFITVFPNPTNSQIKIEAEDFKHITISNMLGQVIYEGKASGNEFVYDFGKHGAGLYLIRIETANGLAVKKVSVTR